MKSVIAVSLMSVLVILLSVQSAWHSGQELHTIMETTATLVAGFVGLLALIRYFAQRDIDILMLSAAFFGATAMNTFHLLGTSLHFSHFIGADWQDLVPWSWMAERMYLGLYLLAAGDTLWALRNPELHVTRLKKRAVLASIFLVLACLSYFTIIPSGNIYIQDHLIGRPLEIFPALFFLLAFVAYYRLGDWRNGGLDFWLLQSIAVAFMAQLSMMFAHQNFDAAFDASHILKVFSTTLLLYGLSREIYNLYRTEEKTLGRLTQNELLLAEAQEIAHIGNWEWNIVNNEIYWSDELYRIFGRDRGGFDISFENYTSLIHEEDRDEVKELIQKCFEHGQPYEITHRTVPKDGQSRWLHSRGKATRDEEGKIVRLSGTSQDVTEIRKTQQHLEIYAKELERSNVELERFAYVASHDMKEPLRKIQAFGDRLAERYSTVLDENGKDYIRRMQDAASRMYSLIEDMLTFSRIETRSSAWELTDLQLLVDNTLRNLDLQIQECNAKIKSDPLPVIQGHPWQLEMLLHNLIGNALKYRSIDRTPEIEIRVVPDSPEKDWVEISIQDNGIGFHMDHADQIFEPFERLHTHKDYPGTGVGLSICRKVVDRHNGRIFARGHKNGGACFTIQLPVKQSDDPA